MRSPPFRPSAVVLSVAAVQFACGSNGATGGAANTSASTGAATYASGSTSAVTGANTGGASSHTGSASVTSAASSLGASNGGTSGTGGSAHNSSVSGSSASSGVATSAGSTRSGSSSSSSPSGSDAGMEGPVASGVSAFPAPGSTDVCPDPPLRLTFTAPPTLGSSGKIQVYDASQPGTAVAAVDMGASAYSDTIGGTLFVTERPAYVDGNDAVIYLPSRALTYGKTYYVTVDSGAITGPSGAVSITDSTTWRFTTVSAAPTSLATLDVAVEGGAPFCTVQRAIDTLPANNATAATIAIAPGIYHEIIHFTSKNKVTLEGQDLATTIIEGTNNNNLNPTTSTRSLVGIDRSSQLIVDTLTIKNLTPQGGSQAEALRLQSCDECVVRNSDIESLQDTVLWEGRVYAQNTTIAGNVDFVWGQGTAYFDKCTIRTVGRAGAVVQARNPASTYGYVFVDSTLTADTGVTGQVLARIDVSQYPASQVAYVNTTMGSFIAPAGWTITGGTDTSQLRFSEYESVDANGNAIDVSKRVTGSTQLTPDEATQMRDPTVVLAGWQPPQ